MYPLSPQKLLNVLEQGWSQSWTQRALSLVLTACPESAPEAVAALSIGRLDAWLLTLREGTFGSRIEGLMPCPICGERLEMSFDTADIRAGSMLHEHQEQNLLSLQGYEISFRLPNVADLSAIAAYQSLMERRQRLLERCLLTVCYRGKPKPATKLPTKIMEAIEAAMEQADPQANVQLDLTCPQCGHAWQAGFDILSFFWSELEAWAPRLLREVHILASAYGWREADILSLSPWRRQCYLAMVGT